MKRMDLIFVLVSVIMVIDGTVIHFCNAGLSTTFLSKDSFSNGPSKKVVLKSAVKFGTVTADESVASNSDQDDDDSDVEQDDTISELNKKYLNWGKNVRNLSQPYIQFSLNSEDSADSSSKEDSSESSLEEDSSESSSEEDSSEASSEEDLSIPTTMNELLKNSKFTLYGSGKNQAQQLQLFRKLRK